MGYHWAGFEVVGVDVKPQTNYPFDFYQLPKRAQDALESFAPILDEAAALLVSPHTEEGPPDVD